MLRLPHPKWSSCWASRHSKGDLTACCTEDCSLRLCVDAAWPCNKRVLKANIMDLCHSRIRACRLPLTRRSLTQSEAVHCTSSSRLVCLYTETQHSHPILRGASTALQQLDRTLLLSQALWKLFKA